ncbi:unnamed protein product [Dicrocoelium dendriticum]|nr:unnamed protein product [Dicrocoelium dendriticum]
MTPSMNRPKSQLDGRSTDPGRKTTRRLNTFNRRPNSAPVSLLFIHATKAENKRTCVEQAPMETSPNTALKGEVSTDIVEVSGKADEKTIGLDSPPIEDEYDRALKIYGWRMEIPGDPLGIKRHFLRKRLPYNVPISFGPDMLPPPPKMRYQNRRTFFQPTINIQPLSFTISPDFESEVFVTKQNELRKTGNWPFQTYQVALAY